MARYAILSDIHANPIALNAVLKHIDEQESAVEGIWCLGDLVNYGMAPDLTLRTLRDRDILDHCVQGNNDYAIGNSLTADSAISQLLADPEIAGRIKDPEVRLRRVTIMTSHNWTWSYISERRTELLGELQKLPSTLRRAGALLLHASPCEPKGMEGNYLRDAADAEEAFYVLKGMDISICFFGHTHLPTVFEQTTAERSFANVQRLSPKNGEHVPLNGNKMLINPGSVGQPRNRDPRAHYVIYNTQGYVEFHRVEYDLKVFQTTLDMERDAFEGNIPDRDRDLEPQVFNTLSERFQLGNW